MKKYLILLILIPLFFSCELIQEPPSQGKVYGVFIGLDYHGTNQNPLSGTLNDARELKDAFEHIARKSTLSYQPYLMLQDKNISTYDEYKIEGVSIPSYATYENVKTLLAQLEKVIKPEDLLIITYHGHGTENLITFAPKMENEAEADRRTVSTEILPLFDSINGRKLLILDSCESGTSISPSASSTSLVYEQTPRSWFETYFSKERYAIPSTFLLTSAADSDAYEFVGEHGHGVFTLALLEGLGAVHNSRDFSPTYSESIPALRKGVISVDSLYTYIKNNQRQPLRTSLSNPAAQYQHPMTNGGAMDFILFHL